VAASREGDQLLERLWLEAFAVEEERGCGLDAECTAVGLVAADPLERRRVGVVGVELRHVEADLFGECAEEGVERDLLLTQEAWVSNIFEYIASNWS
jgi:hypothetical protein